MFRSIAFEQARIQNESGDIESSGEKDLMDVFEFDTVFFVYKFQSCNGYVWLELPPFRRYSTGIKN